MECNKEEAVRAKEIAEKKMQDGDFSGAQKLARKAQQLFPGLDNVSHLLTVCEVHCSAQNKILGSETDWYAVLQIERLADEMTIKKQYRKLALVLHPDKNKFPGAEAAFKLIGEANRVLSDKTKRSTFDLKFRPTAGTCAPKPHPQQSQRNTSRKQGAANNVPKPPYMHFTGANRYQNADKTTFWTCCSSCNIRYQYQRAHVNKVLHCQSCQKSFTAFDLGSRGMPSPNHWSPFPNQNGVPNPVFQNGVPTPGPSKGPSQSNRGKASAMAQEKVDGRGNVKEGVRMHKPYVANGKEGVGKPKPDGGKPSECRTSRNSDKKRKRKSEGESSESYEAGNDDDDEDVDLEAHNFGINAGHQSRRSSRQKQNVSYNENKNENDDFVSPARANAGECKAKEKDNNFATNPETLEYPDPEFSDFDKDKAENCFAVNQVWAIYDMCDGMPRFYARVSKVFSPGFKLEITWLEPEPDDECENEWCDVDLPVACGKFVNGSKEVTEDRLMFSHQISIIKGTGRSPFLIYPKKGEIWALFSDWDIKWSSDPKNHKPPYRFEFVEVMTDFKEHGIGVAYLGKVKGFVSVFQRIAKNGVVSFHVAVGELFRFSHRIPSFRLTGKEKNGVPEGSFELDPASLPANLDELNDPGDYKMENRKQDTEPSVSYLRSSKGNVKSTSLPTTQEDANKPLDAKKNEKHNSVPKSKESASPSVSVRNGSSTNVIETNSPTSRKVAESELYDFMVDKSQEKFKIDQIWALYSSSDVMPKSYAQVKGIESTPDFRLHVALLEACLPPKDPSQPVCCGTFKFKNDKPKVLPRSAFSHQLKAKPLGRNRFEVYPQTGEVWALYKNWNSNKGECEIVEVLEDNDQCIKVAILMRVNGAKALYRAPRSQRSKTGFMEIQQADLTRFSHQIPALQVSAEKGNPFKGYWNLDPLAIPGNVICLE